MEPAVHLKPKLDRKELLWHRMREDAAKFDPEVAETDCLRCCGCGRLLPFEDFSLEHIIPQQSLGDDPIKAKEVDRNIRSGNILLCTRRLTIGHKFVHSLGCNSWKGRNYDSLLREIFNRNIINHKHKVLTTRYSIAVLCAAYLALIFRYGSRVAFMSSGILMRNQFFTPDRYFHDMPVLSQIMLVADDPKYEMLDRKYWENPFSFNVQPGECFITMRGIAVRVPLSFDPEMPIGGSLLIRPKVYDFRPDLRTVFS